MGSDIHSFVSVRDKGTGAWRQVHMYYVDNNYGKMADVQPQPGRNYVLFGLLAGVRYCSAGGPIDTPRGIDETASAEVYFRWQDEQDYCHDASWLTLAEIEKAAHDKRRYNKEERNTLKELASNIKFMMAATYNWNSSDDVRLDFWFDS